MPAASRRACTPCHRPPCSSAPGAAPPSATAGRRPSCSVRTRRSPPPCPRAAGRSVPPHTAPLCRRLWRAVPRHVVPRRQSLAAVSGVRRPFCPSARGAAPPPGLWRAVPRHVVPRPAVPRRRVRRAAGRSRSVAARARMACRQPSVPPRSARSAARNSAPPVVVFVRLRRPLSGACGVPPAVLVLRGGSAPPAVPASRPRRPRQARSARSSSPGRVGALDPSGRGLLLWQ
jgi:hypothetical protein